MPNNPITSKRYSFLKKSIKSFVTDVRPSYFQEDRERYLLQEARYDYQNGYTQKYKSLLQKNFEPILCKFDNSEDQVACDVLHKIVELPPKKFAPVVEYLGTLFSAYQAYDDSMNFFPISVVFEMPQHKNALDWLMVHVQELNLTGLELNTGVDKGRYKVPYRQCLYCGRLDTDSVGTPFTNKKRFCHLAGCPTDSSKSSNPGNHEPGCCFAQWKKEKKEVCQKLQYQLEAGYAEKKIARYFLDFCQERFTENQEIAQPIRNKLDVEFANTAWAYKKALEAHNECPLHPLTWLRQQPGFPYWREKEIKRRQKEHPERELFFPEAQRPEYKFLLVFSET